jgi:hypothetical protein
MQRKPRQNAPKNIAFALPDLSAQKIRYKYKFPITPQKAYAII